MGTPQTNSPVEAASEYLGFASFPFPLSPLGLTSLFPSGTYSWSLILIRGSSFWNSQDSLSPSFSSKPTRTRIIPFLEEFNADWLRQDLILKITFDIRKARTLTSPQGTNSTLFFTSIKTLISRSNKPNTHIYFGAHREGVERAFQVISFPADSVPPYGFLSSLPLPYASTTPRSSSSSFESTARSGWKVRYHCALVGVGLRKDDKTSCKSGKKSH